MNEKLITTLCCNHNLYSLKFKVTLNIVANDNILIYTCYVIKIFHTTEEIVLENLVARVMNSNEIKYKNANVKSNF